MIDFIEGELARWEASLLVVRVHGLGLSLLVSAKTAELFAGQNGKVRLDTYLHVREDALELYGFGSTLEREVFLRLISVSGVGPKLALRILSFVSPAEMVEKIQSGNTQGLMSIKGIGKKTAEVLIANLRSPFQKLSLQLSASPDGKLSEQITRPSSHAEDAVKALCSLGLKENEAEKAVQKVLSQNPENSNTSFLVAQALKFL